MKFWRHTAVVPHLTIRNVDWSGGDHHEVAYTNIIYDILSSWRRHWCCEAVYPGGVDLRAKVSGGWVHIARGLSREVEIAVLKVECIDT